MNFLDSTSDFRKKNYFAFAFIYFTISLIRTFFTVYIPVYYFIVINVNRAELAFVQIWAYLASFGTPLMGLLYDRIILKRRKLAISIFCVVMPLGFLLFILNSSLLFFFGFSLGLFFISESIIRAGMSKLFLDSSQNKEIKDNKILVANAFQSIGSIAPALYFFFLAVDLYKLEFWTLFFFFGWSLSLVMFFSFNFLNKDYTPIKLEWKQPLALNYFSMFLVYISYFLSSSDSIFYHLLGPWIVQKFGETAFRVYVFFLLYFFVSTY